MIVGLGLDLVEIARVARLLESAQGARFREKVFTKEERAYCEPRRDRATRYAARFAAKEAFAKALGAPRGIPWTDVHVTGGGAPKLVLNGKAAEAVAKAGGRRAHLTLTHDAGVAAAVVVLEGEP
jgi:holo-[acyl-carrier protein] synthase